MSSRAVGRANDGWRDVRIIAGRIVDVDPGKWTCTVATEVGQRRLHNVDMGAAYLHPYDGEGVLIMPEPGAAVWVARSSEGDYPYFVVTYRGYPSKTVEGADRPDAPNLRTNRPRRSPGEISLQTRDRNGLTLRRGGVTEIMGGPLARTIYSSRRGRVQTIAQNLQFDTLAGSLHWKTERPEKDPNGHSPTRLELRAKEFSDDVGHVARVEAGGQVFAPSLLEDVSAPVVTLQVFATGDAEEDDLAEAGALALDKDGKLELVLTNRLVIALRGAANATLTVSADGTYALEPDSSVEVSAGGDVAVTSSGEITARAGGTPGLGTTHTGAQFSVGLGTAPVIYDLGFSVQLAAAFAEISAVAKVVGLPTVGIDSLISSLGSRTFTATKLSTE